MKVQYFTRNKQTRITQFEHEYRRIVPLTSYTHAHWMYVYEWQSLWIESLISGFLGYTAFSRYSHQTRNIFGVFTIFPPNNIANYLIFLNIFVWNEKIHDEKYGNQKIELRITFSIPRIITIWILSSSFNFSVQMPWFFRYKLSTKTDLIFICFRFCCAFSMQCQGEHGK